MPSALVHAAEHMMHANLSPSARLNFLYRGINAIEVESPDPRRRWVAEVRQDRTFIFLRASSGDELRRRIDELLDRPIAGSAP